ncbi:hypothetical protein BDN71DRAFT_1504325 [Pleurotus eryngii]|uniref:CxC2-like cysteine cluster KDZ transposase-associated domain-containing protein n=1 Tax=Pleurotus eryngii TaxID=5323 RepID=A0A9P6DHF7_PLEER|nr:hypothetical protein BDN71DRAFT_1504325 [Pleurotus eryngii]
MPFHQIQKWTGKYFHPGSLWKVGMCMIVDHGNTDQRCEWLKHKADEQLRLQATCNSQDEGEDVVEEVEDTYRDQRADTDVTIKQCDGGVEERFDIDEIIEELEKKEARHAHSGEEDLDGADEEDEGKAGLPEAPIDHLIAPSMDPDQNPDVLFVHMNGLHSLPYIQCGCGSTQERITGAVRMQLMLASFTIFKTMFTFDVLETSAWPIWSDVWLSPGSSMLPHREEYAEFLRAAENIKTKAPCKNSFRAIENTLLYAKTCDINGIVAIACPRHGCFAPGGVADLHRGEQQKNVDWVLLQSLKYSNMDPEQGLLFFYDIACQYSVHFQRWIGHQLPIGLDTDFAIGKFHVHGHKENCLIRFLSMFIPQSRVVIDAEDTRDEITECVGAKNIAAWTNAVVEAENTRYIDLSVMDIYGMSASYEDHLAVPAKDEPLNGKYQ